MIYDYEIWLVTGNAQNWGRGSSFNDAIGNAIKNGRSMTQAHVYRLQTNERALTGADLWVDDFGSVSYTTVIGEVQTCFQKLPRWDVPKKIIDSFFAFDEEVEEVRYGKQFDVFDV